MVPIWVPFAALFAVLVVVNTFGGRRVRPRWPPTIRRSRSSTTRRDAAPLGLTLFQDVVFVVRRVDRRPARAGADAARGRSGCAGWSASRSAIGVGGGRLRRLLDRDRRPDADLRAARRPGARRRHPGGGLAASSLIAWGVLICVLAPVVEELFFRGFMFTVLARRLGRGVGGADRRRRVRDRPRDPPRRSIADRAGRVRSRVVPPLLAHTVHHSVHGPPRAQQFDHVRRGQGPRRSPRCSRASCSPASAPSSPAPPPLSARPQVAA